MDRHWLSILLISIFKTDLIAPPAKPTTFRGAIKALDLEAEQLITATRSRIPLHDTLQEVAERMN